MLVLFRSHSHAILSCSILYNIYFIIKTKTKNKNEKQKRKRKTKTNYKNKKNKKNGIGCKSIPFVGVQCPLD